MPAKNGTVYHFGLFEFEAQTGELRKNGLRLKLQDQPSQVLLRLLQSSGELVSREELRSTLWRQDTFVDFENGLNTAIKRLREALGDSADNPTFIETIPRKGYRFIAEPKVQSQEEEPAETESRKAIPRGRKAWRRGAIIGAVCVLPVAVFVIWRERPRLPKVTNSVRLSNDGQPKNPWNLPVTDGVHLYFVEGTPWTSGSHIAQMALAGGDTARVSTTLTQVREIYDIYRDGSQLLVTNGLDEGRDPAASLSGAAQLWVQPLPAGPPRRVGDLYVTAACWTPDGQQILYADEHGIAVANKDGTKPNLLAKPPDVVHSLHYAPDGQHIRFQVNILPGFDSVSLWEMDVDGKNVHPLFSDGKESPMQCCGNWSPDGKYYYFRGGLGSEQSIWVRSERQSIFGKAMRSPARLISGPLHYAAPVPSADGKKLFVMGREIRVELLRYDLQTKRFESYLNGISAGPFDFSRDRRWVAYVSYPDLKLWRSRADGTDKIQLTSLPVRAYAPRWSPDASTIAFTDPSFPRSPKIRLVPESGGKAELLSPADDDESQFDPTWMPDGKSIVFSTFKRGKNVGIYRFSLRTRTREFIEHSDGFFSPRVSPDGRFISAFATDSRKLMLFNTATNQWRVLARGQLLGFNQWSNDGKYIYVRESPVDRSSGKAPVVSRIRVSDGRLEHVLSLKDFPQLTDMLAQWLGVAPDDSPVLMRDRSVEEIYALDLTFD